MKVIILSSLGLSWIFWKFLSATGTLLLLKFQLLFKGDLYEQSKKDAPGPGNVLLVK